MVNSSRPSLRGASGRFAPKLEETSDLATSTATSDVSAALRPTTRANKSTHPPHLLSRAPSKKTSTSNKIASQKQAVKGLRLTALARNSRSSGRPHADDPPHPSPEVTAPNHENIPTKRPTKAVVTQPHGRHLLQTTNGVISRLGLAQDVDSLSQVSASDIITNGTAVVAQRQKPTEETRALRSKAGGTRLKSDLAVYFANFDDIIADAPRSPDFLKPTQSIYIVDEHIKGPSSKSRASQSPKQASKPKPKPANTSPEGIDLSSLVPEPYRAPSEDPLADDVFLKPHRRAERKEKQLRNIEKERAQHEKGQLEHLLESLQGPDWLRVMGVTGITDGARKEWEPRRDYFIQEVRALLEKFRIWKEAEKKLVQEKEALLAKEEEEGEGEEDEEEEEEEDVEAGAEDDNSSSANGPDPNDIDAWAAMQLQREAKSASTKPRPRQRPQHKALVPRKPPAPEKPFVSFYSQPHLRAAALGKSRHGRSIFAFGQPMPDFMESDFRLPADYVTPDALRLNARKRRRLNRERKEADMASKS